MALNEKSGRGVAMIVGTAILCIGIVGGYFLRDVIPTANSESDAKVVTLEKQVSEQGKLLDAVKNALVGMLQREQAREKGVLPKEPVKPEAKEPAPAEVKQPIPNAS